MSRRKSEAEKKLAGTARKDRTRAEPSHTAKAPACPAWVRGYGRTIYRRTAAILAEAGVLTAGDREALAAYSVAVSRWRDAEAALDAGETFQRTRSGYSQLTAQAIEARRAREEVARMAAALGLTPTTRSKLERVPPAQNSDADWLLNPWAINRKPAELVS